VAELFEKGKAATNVELGQMLAAVATYYNAKGFVPAKFQSAIINVPVPIELLVRVVEALGASTEGLEEKNKERAEAVRDRDVQIRQAAERLWQKNPTLAHSDRRTAEKLREDPALRSILTIEFEDEEGPSSRLMSVRTIRGIIAR
jgi:hypothetical protein